jgi:hypothetical protein
MSRYTVVATWDDVPHLTQEQKDELWSSVPPHERDARAKGIPTMGSGLIYPVREEDITCEPRDIPRHWPRIIGLDFGWDHPTAAVLLAWDRDYDRIYVVNSYRRKEATPIQHAATLRAWGGTWIPIAWPADGYQHSKGDGQQLKDIYAEQGLFMLDKHATHPSDEKSTGVEAGLMGIMEYMETDRFKVFNDQTEWLEERRMYHRDEGKIVKLRDDLMDATRYGCMMLRFAATPPASSKKRDKHRFAPLI